jgi:hypothetical protein
MPGATPPYRRALLARAVAVGSAIPSPRRSRPAREASCDTRYLERSGLGRSLGREQSRPECRASVARPLTSRNSGGCFARKATSDRAQAAVATAPRADRDVRVVRGRARGDIHLQKSQGRARPRLVPRKRRGKRSSRCHRTPVKTRGSCAGRPAGAARCDGLPRGCPPGPVRWKVPRSRNEPPGIDVPAASRDQATGNGPFTGPRTRRRQSWTMGLRVALRRSAPQTPEVPEDVGRQGVR